MNYGNSIDRHIEKQADIAGIDSNVNIKNDDKTKLKKELESHQVIIENVENGRPVNYGFDAEKYDFTRGYAELVERLVPAVVNVFAVRMEEDFDKELEMAIPDANDILNFMFGNGQPKKQKTKAIGTAFFISKDGYLLTNHHVVENAKDITITMHNGTEYKAKLIGYDAKGDLAVLKVDATYNFPFVEFGDSDKVRLGDKVLAIGSPFGFKGSVTHGIVSGKTRALDNSVDEFIQIDASINMGNSGGPTFSLDGKVIGINTMIVTPNAGSIGLGFAISSNMAQPIIKKLKSGKSIKRGMIGVQIQAVSPDIANAIGLNKVYGALIADVSKNTPAEKAGLKKGDVILKINGIDIKDFGTMQQMTGNLEIGTTAIFVVNRYGQNLVIKVKIEDQDSIEKLMNEEFGEKELKTKNISVKSLNKQLRLRYRIPNDIDGVLVSKIKDNGDIHFNIEVGDVIMQINEKEIKTINDFNEALKTYEKNKKKYVLVHIYRLGVKTIIGSGL